MGYDAKAILITPTWAGDLDHFRLMRRSLDYSGLGNIAHYVVVQHEDLGLFEEFSKHPSIHLLSTEDVLPAKVERRRVLARRLSGKLGRNLTRLCGSLKRVFGWPVWPSYTGWHTQQLCKLKLASELDCDIAVVIDSDVVAMPGASLADFSADSRAVCFADWQPRSSLRGKVANWVAVSEHLAGANVGSDPVNAYFDTPFVFDRELLLLALSYLEDVTGKPWWQVLLDRPPRRWSEFGYYKAFLMHRCEANTIEWREPRFCRYIFDTSNPKQVIKHVRDMHQDAEVHYVTIHSQASGREVWDSARFTERLRAELGSGSWRK